MDDAKQESKEMSSNEDWETLTCNQISTEWSRGRQYVDDLDDLFDDIYDMIRGERPQKNYDWQSNITINKTFQIVWTAVPYLMKKIFGASPMMGVASFDKKGAWQREQILEFWHNLQGIQNSDHIPFFLIVLQMLIRLSLNGSGFMKKTWKQTMKTINGKKVAVEDWPNNTVISNKDIVFDWLLSEAQSINQGRFVIHRSVQDLGTLYDTGMYKNLDQIKLDKGYVNSEMASDHSEGTDKNDQESAPQSDMYTDVEIYERVGLWNVYKEDGEWIPIFTLGGYEDKTIQNKYMVAVSAKGGEDSSDVLIRFEPAEYGEINYIDVKGFLDTERFNSMGMVEPAKDTILAQNDVFNGITDEMWKNLMQPVIVNSAALWDWGTMKYAPHQRWLLQGSPKDAIDFVPQTSVSRDAWQTLGFLDNETQQTSVTNAMAGAGKEKTATTNVMNAQLSAGKFDFILKMVEVTFLIPSAQMDIRFAKKFAKQETLDLIVGMAAVVAKKEPEPFKFSDWEEVYQYKPAASSVKDEYRKETSTQKNLQALQILGSVKNPKVAKIMNHILADYLRDMDMPYEGDMLDEDYFEPESETGQINQIMKTMGGASNEQGVPMSAPEQGVRERAMPTQMKAM